MIAMYAMFTAFGLLLGLGFGSIVSTLQQITFLTAAYALIVLALNLQWGYAGLLNIGVAGFMAVGVYTMAILTASPDPGPTGVPGLGLPLLVGILGGMLAAALFGGLVALPAIRLRADYLAIVTLAFGEIIRIAVNSQTFQSVSVLGFETGTGGSRGIQGPTNPVRALYYTDPMNPASGSWTAVGNAVLPAFEAKSPFGRVLKAIREDELVAKSLGKHTSRFKIITFMTGCALMGLGGMLWQGSQSLITPDQFDPLLTFYVFIALIIGGSGSNTGGVIGAALFVGLLFQGPVFASRLVSNFAGFESAPNTFPDAVAGLGSLDAQPLVAYSLSEIQSLRFVLVGVVLILVMAKRPQGVLGHRKSPAVGVDPYRRDPDGDETESRTDRGDANEATENDDIFFK
ncbi:branched-chain amino acid ABC transporter permease [Halobacteriales archaeon QH_6_66_25]|nr:MAG: branched-chain amino acid ABC transporter permease [Halobacteriales archaeon QH_6_66_25]